RLDANQNFLINRLAAHQLGEHAGAESVAPMIRALYLFPPNAPNMRMNDVATEVLVRIGQPSVEPLLETLRGNNSEANELAESYIAAVRERDEGAAEQMSVEQVVGTEATVTLGKLGFAAALDPLLAETRSEDMFRRVNGSVALVSLILDDAGRARVREALLRVYGSLGDEPQAAQARAQLIVAMTKTYDPSYIEFLTAQARDTDVFPVARIEAVKGIANLANKAEAEALQAFIASLDRPGEDNDDPYLQQFQTETTAPLALAIECDADLACYIGKLGDSEVAVVKKAATMLGRLGAGNAEAITALVERLGHSDIGVRFAALYALDRIASGGSEAAVERISELERTEDGRGIWTRFSQDALPIQARLRARM
ncbi:MAG: HEAT repeat domain-containing protein, partial [Myxococcota bacterium]